MNKKIDNSNAYLKIDGRFILRAWKKEDLPDLHEMLIVEGVPENLGFRHSQTMEDTQKKLDGYLDEKCNFAIVDTKVNKVIGSLGLEKYTPSELLVSYDKDYGRELYGYVSPEYWGHRIMSRSIRQVMEYGFEKENLDFIIAGHFHDNIKSKRMIKSYGFTYTNTIQLKTSFGKIVPTDLYILWRKDFEQHRAADFKSVY